MEIFEVTLNETDKRLHSLKEKLCNNTTVEFFGLTLDEISAFLETIKFTTGRWISPMFLSPGYGGNETSQAQIQMTLFSNSPDTYCHEAKHGLHYMVCTAIFERPDMSAEAFRLFIENVLNDLKFINQIEQKGSAKQKEFVEKARNLMKKESYSLENIKSLSMELGALTYQHAYFVDPRMCEAVASFGDTGITKVVGDINRIFASLIPPYHQNFALKGYGDTESQSMFKQANLFQKALLIKKDNYNRKHFFNKINNSSV
ncbi:MAG: hypothetical protein Fur009_6500 [Candidatus Microgenomates bacterium]